MLILSQIPSERVHSGLAICNERAPGNEEYCQKAAVQCQEASDHACDTSCRVMRQLLRAVKGGKGASYAQRSPFGSARGTMLNDRTSIRK